ncbi:MULTISPECIES: DUF6266 family protein [unclassified Myroides]|uniref:DUF6266 family protein n=1 Tax=unclassified Myroides TaxID=2642485 RepID=UPI0031019461
MARIPNGILGEFTGSIGTVIGYNYRGQKCMRTKPKKSNYKSTPAQLKQQQKFKLSHEFLYPLSGVTDLYFGHKIGAKSRTNLALSHLLLYAIKDIDDNLQIDYQQVVITKGYLPAATITEVTLTDEELRINWTPNGGRDLALDSDKAKAVLFCKKQRMFFIPSTEVVRSEGAFTSPLPENWKAKNCIVWFFFAKQDDSECSTSVNFYGLI